MFLIDAEGRGRLRQFCDGTCSLGGREGQVHVVDAKSIYGPMLKEDNASARDRRTALDLAVICEALENARGYVRWIPHGRMPSD
eukprot:1181143-Pyramimonas_sp.AAC.1